MQGIGMHFHFPLCRAKVSVNLLSHVAQEYFMHIFLKKFPVKYVTLYDIGPQYMTNNARLENPELSAQSLFFSGLNNTNTINT